MIRFKRQIFFWMSGLVLVSFLSVIYINLSSALAGQEKGELTLKIIGFGIRHGTPNNVNLGMPTTSPNDQEIIGQFDDNFWVEDLQGYTTGHYSTIQCDGVYGSAGNRLTGVYLKAGNLTPTLIQGTPGNVLISDGLTDYVSILSPITYIYKPNDIHNAGIANRYGDIPRLKIFIPGGTPPGTYKGTIVFSLYPY